MSISCTVFVRFPFSAKIAKVLVRNVKLVHNTEIRLITKIVGTVVLTRSKQ